MKKFHSIGENIAIVALSQGAKISDLSAHLGVCDRTIYRYLKVVSKAKERIREWGLQK